MFRIEPHIDKTNEVACVPSEDSDLIRVFTVRMKLGSLATQWAHSEDSGCPVWAESSRAYLPFCWFCHDVTQITSNSSNVCGGINQWNRWGGYLMIIEGVSSVLHKNLCCGYSIESHCRGDSNDYPQHRFLWRNKQNCPEIITKYPPYLFY